MKRIKDVLMLTQKEQSKIVTNSILNGVDMAKRQLKENFKTMKEFKLLNARGRKIKLYSKSQIDILLDTIGRKNKLSRR